MRFYFVRYLGRKALKKHVSGSFNNSLDTWVCLAEVNQARQFLAHSTTHWTLGCVWRKSTKHVSFWPIQQLTGHLGVFGGSQPSTSVSGPFNNSLDTWVCLAEVNQARQFLAHSTTHWTLGCVWRKSTKHVSFWPIQQLTGHLGVFGGSQPSTSVSGPFNNSLDTWVCLAEVNQARFWLIQQLTGHLGVFGTSQPSGSQPGTFLAHSTTHWTLGCVWRKSTMFCIGRCCMLSILSNVLML